MKSESNRQIAERIVDQIAVGAWQFQSRGAVVEWIEAALDAERERAAKIADGYAAMTVNTSGDTGPGTETDHSVGGRDRARFIAAAIRGSEE